MVITKKKLKVLGMPIPGTAKVRRFRWEKIDILPKWIKIRRPSSGSKLIQGKTYIYKVTAYKYQGKKFKKTFNNGVVTFTEDVYKVETGHRYYRRKRGFQ